MSDDIKGLFESGAPSIPVPPRDLPEVIGDGRKRLLRRRVATVSSSVVVIGAMIVALMQIGGREERTPISPKPDESAAVETMTDQEKAEVFAFRAVSTNGLMNPFGKRSYMFTYAEDTTRTDDGWRIGFAASDCEPRESSFTCRGLSGEDQDLGNALTDTYIFVVLDEGEWRVVDVEGNMLEDERSRLIGYTLPDREEPSHWEFPAVGVRSREPGGMIDLVALWVGPYPTSAPGSVCDVEMRDGNGNSVGEPWVFYQEPPNRPFERAGWIRGRQLEPVQGLESAVVNCHQYTGLGWKVASEPELVGDPGEVIGVAARLEWYGDEGFTGAAVCHATVVDEAGEQMGEGSGRLVPRWSPGDLKDFPYEAQVFVSLGSEPVDAHTISEFTCESQ